MPYNYNQYSFTPDYQDAILACLTTYPEKFLPYAHVLNSAFFTGVERIVTARALFAYWRKNSRFPSWHILGQIVFDSISRSVDEKEADRIRKYIDKLRDVDTGDADTVADNCIEWARRRALWVAIEKAFQAFQAGDIPADGFIPMFEEALKVGINQCEFKNALELSDAAIDPADTLLGDRFLCRKGGGIVAACAGSGKSVSVSQMSISWSCGRPAFGILPQKPLKILVAQAEDDEGDLKEMTSGVVRSLALTEVEKELVSLNTFFASKSDQTGDEFLGWLRAQCCQLHPDLIIINPLNSFIGGNGVQDAATVTRFLRNGLNPILHENNCGALIIHHTVKTTSKDQQDPNKWRPADTVYMYAGVNEIANWCRCMIAIVATHDDSTFRFIAAKRGKRVGWKDNFGQFEMTRYFCWTHDDEGTLFWREATEEDLERASKKAEQSKKSGRPRMDPISDKQLLSILIRAENEGKPGLTQVQWLAQLEELATDLEKPCPSQPTLSRRLKELKNTGKIILERGGIWRIKTDKVHTEYSE